MMKLEHHLQKKFLEKHPLEAARYLEGRPAQETRDIFLTMEPAHVAQTLEYFSPSAAATILKECPPAVSAEILGRLSPGFSRAILRQVDPSTQETLLGHLEPRAASLLRRTIHLSEHTAGSLADPLVLTLPPDITVGDALQRIVHVPHQAIYYLYIIDRGNILIGVVLMKELLTAEPASTLTSIMNQEVKVIPSSANARDIVAHPAWARFDSLPVIAQDKTFIGALRHRTLRQYLQSKSIEYRPAFLSDGLLQLWEAYSLSGMVLMTTIGNVLTTMTPSAPAPEEQETS